MGSGEEVRFDECCGGLQRLDRLGNERVQHLPAVENVLVDFDGAVAAGARDCVAYASRVVEQRLGGADVNQCRRQSVQARFYWGDVGGDGAVWSDIRGRELGGR